MPNKEMLIHSKPQHLTEAQNGQQEFCSTIDLKYAYSQVHLHKYRAKYCNLNIIVENLQELIDLKPDSLDKQK